MQDHHCCADGHANSCADGISDGDADAATNCGTDACPDACTDSLAFVRAHQAHHCPDGRAHSRAVACAHPCADQDPCELRAQRLVRVDAMLAIMRWRPPLADPINRHCRG